VKLKKTWRS